MTTTTSKSLPELLKAVLFELEGHPDRARFEELYDSDDDLAGALNSLPDFEYPDVAHMTVKELRQHYGTRLKWAEQPTG